MHTKSFRRHTLSLAITAAITSSGAGLLQAGQIDGVFELSDLNGTNGFAVYGPPSGGLAGFDISAGSDFNGDGIGDLIIGAPGANPDGNTSGTSYVVFGTSNGLPNPLELSDLNGMNGFVLNGVTAYDSFGSSVSQSGDLNGDGVDDIVIGASGADPNGNFSGASYVVFGSTTTMPAIVEITDLNGDNGFVINGAAESDRLGSAVSTAGDVNADGIDDLIIGAPFVDNGSGAGYVIFGTVDPWPASLELSSLNGVTGFVLNGTTSENAGRAVSSLGDFNVDGIDDMLIGAPSANSNGERSGAGYVVFGSAKPMLANFELSELDGTNGFVIKGLDTFDRLGTAVSHAGDINGDNISDILIGAFLADPDGTGASYVVFGSAAARPASLEVSDLNGIDGFAINGVGVFDNSGRSLSGLGDVNGDGIDDVIIGADRVDSNGDESGAGYVVFGSTDNFSASFNLSELNGTNGFVLNGINAGDFTGRAVSHAGDMNGDGINDVMISANRAHTNGISTGDSYVVYGNDLFFEDSFEN